ncbi:MAG: transcriptional repressor LexA [Alphaproteobacteria bacterium]|nr:transcriptional repressor LexA [Alphaproteobacteria bacterium]
MEDLAPRQREILEYIASVIDQKGIAPTYREIGDALGIRSTNGVSDHVKALIRKGYLTRPAGRGSARSLRLTDHAVGGFNDQATVSVPLLGRVAAGLPLLADENYDSSIRVDASLVPANVPCFALKVSGESMIEAGILDGDIVIVKQQQTARNGEVVVVRVGDEATVKRFFKEGARVRLQPENSTMEPIYVDARDDAAVVGRVVGLWRTTFH